MKLPSLRDVHVVVAGDVMLDRYWSGPAHRISQEAPVPVIDVHQVDDRPGGAANVALNVVSLGARCSLIGAVGDDDEGRTLAATLTAAGVDCHLHVTPAVPTIVKLRILSRKQQLLRADFDARLPVPDAELLLERALPLLDDASVLVLQDYDKGALDDPAAYLRAARARSVPVVVDPKRKPFSSYAGAAVLKPNESEFSAAAGPWADDNELVALGVTVCASHNVDSLVITRGGRGMTIVEDNGVHCHLPASQVDVFDVTGAGDTVAAALAVTRALGWAAPRCAELANAAAGIAVTKTGTATVSGPELAAQLADVPADRGVLNRARLLDAVTAARTGGARIVFTNGCFDILHAGHVAYLEEAARLGDRLVVAVNDDASVQRLKGEGRPVNGIEQRARVLAGLSSVDWVVAFAEDTPEALLELLEPDVLVKGGDYSLDEVVGADLVRRRGGEVRVLGLTEDSSTSRILEQLQDR